MGTYFRDTQLGYGTAKSLVKHVVLECHGIPSEMLAHLQLVGFIERFCSAFELHIVEQFDHQFSPYGSTIVFVLEESHIAVHSWPEFGYLHCDIVTCSPEHLSPAKIKSFTTDQLTPEFIKILRLKY